MNKAACYKLIALLSLLLQTSNVIAEKEASSALSNLGSASPSVSGSVWQMALGLVLVLAVIFLLTWLMRRVTGIQGTRQHIKILSAINVGTRERAVLVEVAGEQLLLGVAAGQVSLLHKVTSPVTVDSVDFSSSLQQATTNLVSKAKRSHSKNK
jgi:flagellar protein FliO/FliZ